MSDRSRLKTVVAFSHIDQPGDGGTDLTAEDFDSRPSRTYSPIAFRRVMASRLSTELQVRGETSSFGATLYTRYNELDLLPSWQLTFDPQVWVSRHRSVGLLTRYRRAGGAAPDEPQHRRRPRVHAREPDGDRDRAPRAGAVFAGYTQGEVQYDYDVTFWQASPYAQADISLPGRVQLSAGRRATITSDTTTRTTSR